MSCFWNGILYSLNNEEKARMGISSMSAKDLIRAFKELNTPTLLCRVQGERLSRKAIHENCTWIKDYDVNQYNSGHMTSTCDPFLCLLCEILKVEIRHVYVNKPVIYSIEGYKRVIVYKSSRTHFEYVKNN